jgi:hypothetical protein
MPGTCCAVGTAVSVVPHEWDIEQLAGMKPAPIKLLQGGMPRRPRVAEEAGCGADGAEAGCRRVGVFWALL